MASSPDFRRIERRFFETFVQLDPTRASEMGLEEAVSAVPSGLPDVFDAGVANFERARDELRALAVEGLDDEQRLDVELVANEAAALRLVHDHGAYAAAGRDPALEATEMVEVLFSRSSFPAALRAEGIRARLEGVPAFLEQAKARYRRPVGFWVEETRENLGHRAAFFDEVRDGVPALLGGALGDLDHDPVCRAVAAAAEVAKRAMEDFGRWLEAEVAPRAVDDFAMGPEAFGELVRLRRLGHDVEALEELGSAAYAELGEAYARALDQRFPGASVEAAEAAWLEEAPGDFEALLEMFRRAVSASRDFVVDRLGIPLPGAERLEVRATPPHLRSSIPSAAYFDPPRFLEGEQVGIYMVTPSAGEGPILEHTPGMVFNVSTHEGYPGHHLQLSWANRNPSLFRACLSGDEFCEGWAHYCEEMMTDVGFAPVPGMRAAQLCDARFRALRILVDIGLQTGELSRQAAIERLVTDGGITPGRAAGEVGWYSYSPGYPLGYLTGKVLLKALRQSVEAAEGEAFDATRFHARVLEGGTMPIWAHAERLGQGGWLA